MDTNDYPWDTQFASHVKELERQRKAEEARVAAEAARRQRAEARQREKWARQQKRDAARQRREEKRHRSRGATVGAVTPGGAKAGCTSGRTRTAETPGLAARGARFMLRAGFGLFVGLIPTGFVVEMGAADGVIVTVWLLAAAFAAAYPWAVVWCAVLALAGYLLFQG